MLGRFTKRYDEIHLVKALYTPPSSKLQNVDHITCEAAPEYTRWVIEHIDGGVKRGD